MRLNADYFCLSCGIPPLTLFDFAFHSNSIGVCKTCVSKMRDFQWASIVFHLLVCVEQGISMEQMKKDFKNMAWGCLCPELRSKENTK